MLETPTIPPPSETLDPPSDLAMVEDSPEPFIYRTVQHIYPTKKMRLMVEEHIVEFGVAPDGFPLFTAPIRNLPIGQVKPGQMVHINGDIPVPADSVPEAMTMLPQILNEELPKLVAAAKKSILAPKIVVGGATPNGEDFDWGGQKFKLGLSR